MQYVCRSWWDVINFEINLIFLIKYQVAFLHDQNFKKKIENENSF